MSIKFLVLGGGVFWVWGGGGSADFIFMGAGSLVSVKIGDFNKFKGFFVEFLENRRSSESQMTPENR